MGPLERLIDGLGQAGGRTPEKYGNACALRSAATRSPSPFTAVATFGAETAPTLQAGGPHALLDPDQMARKWFPDR